MKSKNNLSFVIAVLALFAIGCVCGGSNSPQNTSATSDSTTQAADAEPCPINYEDAPGLKGFRLGMTTDQIRKKVPAFRAEKADEFGYSETFLVNQKATVPKPQGIPVKDTDNLMTGLEMVDGRLIAISSYILPTNLIFKPTAGEPQPPEGITIERYQERVPESLNLPLKLRKEDASGNYLSLTCKGFKVKAGKTDFRYSGDILPTTYWFHSVEDFPLKESISQKRSEALAEKKRRDEKRRLEEANSYKP